MNKILWLVGGIAAAAAYFVAQNQAHHAALRTPVPVDDLAHKLQDAWADHHTVA
jgi:hypothetical protein